MIRDLAAAELAGAAHLAAAAFREDPGFSHVLPDDAERRLRLPSLIEAILRVNASRGGRARGAFVEGALVGASAVLPAGAASPRRRDWLGRRRGLGWTLREPSVVLRALALVEAVERLRPASADHLRLLAVHPATRGRGVGAALLRDALKGGGPLYLETFAAESAAWCEARGFARVAQVASAARPTFWTLKR